MVLGVVDFVASTLWRNRANRRNERKVAALRERGVLAPAVVVSASTHRSRSNVDGAFIEIRYVVDVHPNGGTPFRTEFAHWSERRGYTAVGGEIQGEAGRQIWVTFDPSDPADMIFEYDERERIALWQEAELDRRRIEFNDRARPLEPLRKSGAPGRAVVVQVDDLQLPYPRRESIAVDLHVDVTPDGGQTYRAIIPALIAVAALTRFAVGRHVFVRIDPRQPQAVVLDSERNRTLPL